MRLGEYPAQGGLGPLPGAREQLTSKQRHPVPLADSRSIIIMETLQSCLPGMNARMPMSPAPADLAHPRPAQSLHHQNREVTISSSLLLLYATDSLDDRPKGEEERWQLPTDRKHRLGAGKGKSNPTGQEPVSQPPKASLGGGAEMRGGASRSLGGRRRGLENHARHKVLSVTRSAPR